MNISINQFIDGEHLSHYWYGGKCATIECDGYTAIISALGDIVFEYKDEYFKDKNNKGELYFELNGCFNNDKELYTAIKNNEIIFHNNNWWECSLIDENNEFHDLEWCLDSTSLFDAIAEVKNKLPDIIKNLS